MRLHLTFESIDMADGDFRDIDARDRRSAVLSMTLIAESASLSPSSLASSMVCLLGYLNNDDHTDHRVRPLGGPPAATLYLSPNIRGRIIQIGGVAAHGTRAERSAAHRSHRGCDREVARARPGNAETGPRSLRRKDPPNYFIRTWKVSIERYLDDAWGGKAELDIARW